MRLILSLLYGELRACAVHTVTEDRQVYVPGAMI